MQSGPKVEELVALLTEADRRQANLEMAIKLTEEHEEQWNRPEDRLAQAALLAAYSEVAREWRAAEPTETLDKARVLLEDLKGSQAALVKLHLMPTYVYWSSWVLNEGLGDPDGALAHLIEQQPEFLASPDLAARLLLVTEQAISRSTAEKAERTSTFLTRIGALAEGTGWFRDLKERCERLLQRQLEAEGADTGIVRVSSRPLLAEVPNDGRR